VPILTGLAPDPRQSGYRLVEVDRGRFASLPGDALVPLRLDIGREIPAAVLTRLRELADIEAACRAALRVLTRRGHARHDLGSRSSTQRYGPRAAAGRHASSKTCARKASTPASRKNRYAGRSRTRV